MVARFLVTTALEETWPAEDVPVLFLGEWCRPYHRKSAWEKRDAVVAPYHWDDRQKLYKDYLYLQAIYEELLNELAAQLNLLHRVDYSVRYWRIVVGPWLGYFTQMLFDRWAMIRQALRESEISGVLVIRRNEEQLVPNDMAAFISLFVGDAWNESICGQILDSLSVSVESVDPTNTDGESPVNANTGGINRSVKLAMARVSNKLSGLLCRNNEYFLISSYFGWKQDFLLQARLGQIPKLWWPVAVPKSTFDRAFRQWRLPNNSSDEFSALLRALIPGHIPKAYVEGFQSVAALTASLPWPKNPLTIFTSNSYTADDVFKVWAAKKVESGAPLLIGQHGGNFGMAAWAFYEDHQVEIADCFLTWGWNEPGQTKIAPVGIFKGFGRQAIPDKDGVALMVEMTMPRQSYHMYSAPVAAGQWLAYFEDQCRFVLALPTDLREQLLVRLYSQDYGLGQRKRWQARFPDLELDDGVQPMAALLKKTRLYISTYNATTYLESLSLNFPTIIFWNPKHWELRDSALPYFEKLKSVGIFHQTPESAAQQMAAVWSDVSSWWESVGVQSVRQEFCERYAHVPERPLDGMEQFFRNFANSQGAGMNFSSCNAKGQ